MPFIMPSRTECFVLCKQQILVAPARAFLKELNADRPEDRQVTLFHLLLRAIAITLHERPRLNRFVAGGRLYQRRGVWISFSGKQSIDEGSPIYTRKREFPPDENLEQMVAGLTDTLRGARSGAQTTSDREVGLLLRLPPFFLRLIMKGVFALNSLNMVPGGMLRGDPLFASVFVANLGSVGIDACYHHNYEYGSIPLFITMGRLQKAPVVSTEGVLEVKEIFELKYTYDERVEDGLYCARALENLKNLLENPRRML